MQPITIDHQVSDSSVLRSVLPFAVAVCLGAVVLAFQLGSGVSLALATIVALLSATVPLLAIKSPENLSATRKMLRSLGVVQLALLLWISVLCGH